MKNSAVLFGGSLTLFALGACMTVPVSGRKAVNLFPESLERQKGEEAYLELLKKERISHDPRLNSILARVGQRIAAVSGRPDYHWEFKVIDSNTMNAFCLPGGKIAFYRGIFPVNRNESGVATVMAHEVVHAIARHGGQRITENLGTGISLALIENFALKDSAYRTQIMGALGLGVAVGLTLPYSRSHETEADEIGQVLMARAGYDPSESIRFWERFAEATKGHSGPTLLSTHPSSAERAENMRERLPKALEEYDKAPEKHGLGETI